MDKLLISPNAPDFCAQLHFGILDKIAKICFTSRKKRRIMFFLHFGNYYNLNCKIVLPGILWFFVPILLSKLPRIKRTEEVIMEEIVSLVIRLYIFYGSWLISLSIFVMLPLEISPWMSENVPWIYRTKIDFVCST